MVPSEYILRVIISNKILANVHPGKIKIKMSVEAMGPRKMEKLEDF